MEAIAERPKVQVAKADTIAAKLRQVANWIEEHEIGDGAIIAAGVEVGGCPKLVVRDHDVLRVCFPGRAAVVNRNTSCDVMALTVDGIRFEGWKFHEPAVPLSKEVTL